MSASEETRPLTGGGESRGAVGAAPGGSRVLGRSRGSPPPRLPEPSGSRRAAAPRRAGGGDGGSVAGTTGSGSPGSAAAQPDRTGTSRRGSPGGGAAFTLPPPEARVWKPEEAAGSACGRAGPTEAPGAEVAGERQVREALRRAVRPPSEASGAGGRRAGFGAVSRLLSRSGREGRLRPFTAMAAA